VPGNPAGNEQQKVNKAPSPRHGEFQATRPSSATADLRPKGRGSKVAQRCRTTRSAQKRAGLSTG
jgi:hypothetical protein